MAKVQVKSVIHEISNHSHRIVFITETGTDAGKWANLNEVAQHKAHFAVVGESPLPQGVFTTKDVAHEVLGFGD